jgi:GNAT superfamily N-acetyltransferase
VRQCGDPYASQNDGRGFAVEGFRLGRLALDDMGWAARVHRAAFDARLPWLAGLHTPEEDRWFYRERVIVSSVVWGAFGEERLLGIIAFREDWIDQLYVLPDAQGRGVGSALLDIAKRQATELSLWTFQRNEGARRFYERHDFSPVRETDGSENEEREPDVLYRWVAKIT